MFKKLYPILRVKVLSVGRIGLLSVAKYSSNTGGIGLHDDIPTNQPFIAHTEELAKIANMCTMDFVQKTVKFSDKNWFAGQSTDRITQLTVNEVPTVSKIVDSTSSSVTALVLPSSSSWPTFQDLKQVNAPGKNVLLMKKAPMTLLYDKTGKTVLNVLLGGRKVALVGHPGIGKSTELNIIFVDLFRVLMAGKIKDLFHRVQQELYRYHCTEMDGVKTIVCEQVEGAGHSLDTLILYINKAKLKNIQPNNPSSVLVLELDEEEGNLKMTMPTLLALSSRNVMAQVKTWRMGGNVEFSIRPTHTQEELLVLATALFQSPSQPQLLSDLGLPSNTISVEDVHQVIKQRMEIVGPLAREVLGTETLFNLWKDAMENVKNIGEFLNLEESADVFSLPKTAKYYITPDEHRNLRFLSGHVIEKVLKCTKEHHRKDVADLGYAWQAAEYIVKKYCVLNQARSGSAVCKAWDFNAWEYFHNPAPGGLLSRKHALNRKEKADIIAKITKHTREVVFEGALSPMSLERLDSQSVYISSVHTMSIGDFFVVGEDGGMILFQTSTVDPRKHIINLAELKKWVAAVKPKRITIIFFTDWCKKKTMPVTVVTDTETLSNSQVSDNPHSFKSYIVRGGIYDSVNVCRYILSGDATSIDDLVGTYVQSLNEVSILLQ